MTDEAVLFEAGVSGVVGKLDHNNDLGMNRNTRVQGPGSAIVEIRGDLIFADRANDHTLTLAAKGAESSLTVHGQTRVSDYAKGTIVVHRDNTAFLGNTRVGQGGSLALAGGALGAGEVVIRELTLETNAYLVQSNSPESVLPSVPVKIERLTLAGSLSRIQMDKPVRIAPGAILTLAPAADITATMLVVSRSGWPSQSSTLDGSFATITVASPEAAGHLARSVPAGDGGQCVIISGYSGSVPTGLGFQHAGQHYVFEVNGRELVVREDAAYAGNHTDTYDADVSRSSNETWTAGDQGNNILWGGSNFKGGLKEVRFRGNLVLAEGAEATFRTAVGKDLSVTGDLSVTIAGDLRGSVVLDASAAPLQKLITSIGRLDATRQDSAVTLIGVRDGDTRIAQVALGGDHTVTLSRDETSKAPEVSRFSLADGGGAFSFSHDVGAREAFFSLELEKPAGPAVGSDVLFRKAGKAGFTGVTAESFAVSEASLRALATGANRGGTYINIMDGLGKPTGRNPLGFDGTPLVAPVGDGEDRGEYILSSTFADDRLVAYVTRLEVENVTYSASRRFDAVHGGYTEVVRGVMTVAQGASLDYTTTPDRYAARLDLSGARGVSVKGFGNRLAVGPESQIGLADKDLTFIIDAPVDLAKPMLSLASPSNVSLAGAKVYLDATSAGNAAFNGGEFCLLSLEGGGILEGEIAGATLRDGLVSYGGVDIVTNPVSTGLFARFDGRGLRPDTSGGHGYILGAFASQSVLRSAADAVAEAGGIVVPLPGTEVWWNGEYEGVGFATVRGYRETLTPASEVRTTGFSFAGGAGVRWNHETGPLNLLAILEIGRGTYDTEHTFAGARATGGGKAVYLGGGLLARQDFLNGLYLEASLRAGRVENDFRNHRVAGGGDVTLESSWFGAHVAAGYEIPLHEDRGSLDLSSRLLWTRMGSSAGSVGNGQRISIAASDSVRVQMGLRYARQLGVGLRGFLGVTLEQEMDGKVSGQVRRANGQSAALPAADLKGTTAIFESGLNYHMDSGLILDVRLFGSAGERESIGGRISANVAF